MVASDARNRARWTSRHGGAGEEEVTGRSSGGAGNRRWHLGLRWSAREHGMVALGRSLRGRGEQRWRRGIAAAWRSCGGAG